MTVRPLRKFTRDEAFAQLRANPELAANVSAAARAWGCSRDTARRWIAEFVASTGGDRVATGSSTVPIPASPPSSPWRRDMMTTAAYMAAIGLAGVAGYFSICGMLVLFPGLTVLDRMAGARAAIVVMAIAMEIAKLVTVGFLARHWRRIDRLWRIVLLVLVAGLEVINAAGVYSQLVAAHFSHRVATISSVEIQTATTGAMIEVQSNTIADIDRRLNQIDAAVEEATKRGKTNGAIEMIGTQRKARAELMAERRHEADILTKLKIDQAEIAAKARAIEVENAPIRYVAELIGGTTEEAIRMLILMMMMVLCCDPLAIALTAAAAARSKEGIA